MRGAGDPTYTYPVEPAIYAGQFTRPELQPQEFDGTDLEERRTRQRQNSGRPHRSAASQTRLLRPTHFHRAWCWLSLSWIAAILSIRG